MISKTQERVLDRIQKAHMSEGCAFMAVTVNNGEIQIWCAGHKEAIEQAHFSLTISLIDQGVIDPHERLNNAIKQMNGEDESKDDDVEPTEEEAKPE